MAMGGNSDERKKLEAKSVGRSLAGIENLGVYRSALAFDQLAVSSGIFAHLWGICPIICSSLDNG